MITLYFLADYEAPDAIEATELSWPTPTIQRLWFRTVQEDFVYLLERCQIKVFEWLGLAKSIQWLLWRQESHNRHKEATPEPIPK